MFDSLDDRIRHDNAAAIGRGERVVRVLAVSVLSVLLFGGLYFAVRMLGD
jgi:hypothetical protein